MNLWKRSGRKKLSDIYERGDFMNILGKKDKKLHAALELMENKNITSLRKKIKILVVDDESDDIYKILGERKYNVCISVQMNYS